jgi:ABC-type transport system involved in multi-copper enzyme maturation permease subunit
MLLLIGLIGPPLISRDVRSRAFLLYFSRPLSAWEYVLGKASVVWFYIGAISTAPALTLYGLGVLLSPNLGVVADTWDLPFRILGASVLLMVPTTALILMFSSLTTESRYAGFAWFATWVLGWVTYVALTVIEFQADFENFEFDDPSSSFAEASRWSFVSLHHMLGQIQGWIFGLEGSLGSVLPLIVLVTVITVVATTVLIRRVAGQVRA